MTHSSSQWISGGANTNTSVGSSGGFGVKWYGSNTYDIVPLTKNASAYAASQTPGTSTLTLAAGTGVTANVVNGTTRYTADVPRCVTVTSGGNDSGITFLVTGYDTYGAPMTQRLTGGNATVATTTKAFASVTAIAPSAAVSTTATAGTADIFGMPVQVIDKCYVGTQNWNNSTSIDGGTFVVADQTTPATAVTGDVRGTYQPSTSSDGVKRLVMELLYNTNQLSSQPAAANTIAVLGVAQV